MEVITIYKDTLIQIKICQLTKSQKVINYLTEQEIKELSTLKNQQRKKEYLTTRYILRASGIKNTIHYQDKKPYINKDLHLSISHNKKYAGIAISKHQCGIDIEHISERVLRVANKYLNPNEQLLAQDDIDLYTLFWSVKESVYKWDNSHTDFKHSIQIIGIDKSQQTVCVETNQGIKIMNFRIIDNSTILTWII